MLSIENDMFVISVHTFGSFASNKRNTYKSQKSLIHHLKMNLEDWKNDTEFNELYFDSKTKKIRVKTSDSMCFTSIGTIEIKSRYYRKNNYIWVFCYFRIYVYVLDVKSGNLDFVQKFDYAPIYWNTKHNIKKETNADKLKKIVTFEERVKFIFLHKPKILKGSLQLFYYYQYRQYHQYNSYRWILKVNIENIEMDIDYFNGYYIKLINAKIVKYCAKDMSGDTVIAPIKFRHKDLSYEVTVDLKEDSWTFEQYV